MFKVIGLIVLAAIVVVLVLAAIKPDAFVVQRSININAPPDKVFALVSDFKRWPEWSPWERRDPAMTRTLGAITAGTGATYAWEGNKEVGQGRMEITQAIAPTKVSIALTFIKPFAANNLTDFDLSSEGGQTKINWAMRGDSPYVAKVMQVFVSMDKMVGKDFESGLAQLKVLAEK